MAAADSINSEAAESDDLSVDSPLRIEVDCESIAEHLSRFLLVEIVEVGDALVAEDEEKAAKVEQETESPPRSSSFIVGQES